ncbi:MAG: argininosuccinate lyase, partial [Oscillospiraceae bacterium]|nr:argininosuccinate lyase [Oscillospiraceae bacterium]
QAAAAGFINATDCADYLVKKGLPFREAYGVTGRLVRLCIDRGKTLETLELQAYQAVSPLFGEDVYDAIALETCVAARKTPGGPAPGAVMAHIAQTRAFLSVRGCEK